MTLSHVHPFDHHPALAPMYFQDGSLHVAEVPADHLHAVPLHDVGGPGGVLLQILVRHQSTSGARETIFMYFFSLSSRPTGPKMRVPRGSPCGLISTAALSSKRM